MNKLDILYKYTDNIILKSFIKNNDLLSAYQLLYGDPDIKRIFGYTDGELHILSNGIKKEYWDNGLLYREYGVNENGEKDGLYRRWFSNGQLCEECTYKDGKLDGLYRSWWDNGQLYIESIYKDGNLDGIYRRWNSDGILR